MSRSRTCPHCTLAVQVEAGYNFDGDGNLLCAACGKPIVPVTLVAENEIDASIKARTNPVRGNEAWSNRNSVYEGGYRGAGAYVVNDEDAL